MVRNIINKLMEFEFDEEQIKRAQEALKKKQPKVNKKGIIFDSASHEMEKRNRKTSEGSDKSKE